MLPFRIMSGPRLGAPDSTAMISLDGRIPNS